MPFMHHSILQDSDFPPKLSISPQPTFLNLHAITFQNSWWASLVKKTPNLVCHCDSTQPECQTCFVSTWHILPHLVSHYCGLTSCVKQPNLGTLTPRISIIFPQVYTPYLLLQFPSHVFITYFPANLSLGIHISAIHQQNLISASSVLVFIAVSFTFHPPLTFATTPTDLHLFHIPKAILNVYNSSIHQHANFHMSTSHYLTFIPFPSMSTTSTVTLENHWTRCIINKTRSVETLTVAQGRVRDGVAVVSGTDRRSTVTVQEELPSTRPHTNITRVS